MADDGNSENNRKEEEQMNVPETPADDDKKERAKVNKESVKDDKKEVIDVDKSVDGKDEDAVKIAMKSADLEHNDSNAKNETKNSQSHYQTPPVVLPEGWTYQSTSTGSRGYYTYRSEPTPADLTLVNPDHTIAVGVPQGGPGSGYSVNLGGPGNTRQCPSPSADADVRDEDEKQNEVNKEVKEDNLTSDWCAGAITSSNTRQCPSPSAEADAKVLPQGWSYQSTSTGSRGYYTYRSEPTPADLILVPDHTNAVRVPQGGPGGGSGYSVNLGGPGNIIYATGENMPFSIGAPTMHTGGGPVVKSPVKQRSTQENYPVTPSKVKQMPEKLKPMVERHYLLLKSPSFTRQKLELVKIICGFDDTKDKIGIPEDEKRIVVQKYYR